MFRLTLPRHPGAKISSGKVLSARTRISTNRAATVFRMVGVAVGRTQPPHGAFYPRLSARVGKAKAVPATARKLADGERGQPARGQWGQQVPRIRFCT